MSQDFYGDLGNNWRVNKGLNEYGQRTCLVLMTSYTVLTRKTVPRLKYERFESTLEV